MRRWKLLRSDAPLRVRDLPPVPERIPKSYDLEDGFFHQLLTALDQAEKVSPVLLALAGAVVDLWLLRRLGSASTAALALGQAGDWLMVSRLKRLRISFGPRRIQWVTLAALRTLGAVLAAGFGSRLSSARPRGPLQTHSRFPEKQTLGRRALREWLPVVVQATGTLLAVRGFVKEPRDVGLTRIELRVSGRMTAPLRLLHIADVHLERMGRREERLLAMARELAPDVIVFSGDFINLSYVHDEIALRQTRALWRALSEVAPAFAVTGSPPVDATSLAKRILCDSPVRWLRNETCCVDLHGKRLNLVGITCTHDPIRDGRHLRQAIAASGWLHNSGPRAADPARHAGAFTVLLHHSPDLAPQAAAFGCIDLQLYGHTHGGQVRLPGYGALVTGSLYGKQLEMGLYRLNDMLLYVSRGVGFEGMGAPRARLFSPPEVALISLRPEE